MSGDDEERRELLGIFREESQERMANISQSLEALAGLPGATAPLDEIDRELHTIKGSARLLGFMGLGKFVHDLEGFSRAFRVDRSLGTSLLVEACDRLAVLVDHASGGDQDATDDALHARVLAATPFVVKPAGGGRRFTQPEHDDSAVSVPRPFAPPPATPPAPVPELPAAPAPSDAAPRVPDRPAPTPAGASSQDAPAVEEPAPEVEAPAAAPARKESLARRPALGTEATSGATRPGARASTESGARGDAARPGPGPGDGQDETARVGARDEDTIRVRTSRLQTLDEVVSDLSLTKLRLATYDDRMRRLLHSVEDGTAGPTEVCQTLRQLLHDYRNDTIQVHRSTQQLQQLAVDVRLRPVDHLFRHVPREARDLARRLGKDVEVRVQGRETEMDRVILDQLKSPLGHLIRNALDHGLETPEERVRKGKPAQGVLTVRAGQEGGQVAIHVEDDGAGVDPRRVRAIAVQRGLIEASAADAMSDEEAVQLIFTPGFSTKAVATEISGRGVGMDAVRNCVEGLKGDVRVSSRVGEGTRTTIRLPLTLLISRVTFVRSSGQQFAIPTEQVHESVRLPADRVTVFAGAAAVVLGFATVPLVRLAQVLGHRTLPDPPFLRVLVVRHGDDLLALVVEELLEERSVVVKPLGWPLDRVRFMSGAIHLASGEVALLLHVPDLFALARGAADEPRASYKAEQRRTVLVVDDSIVSRQMVGRCVEALGFDLITAQDGADALRLLERVTPDLIVTDVEMPRLGGLGLARRVRQDERLARVPIIIVSSRGGESDRQAGLEAGADAYLPKGDFNETTFRSMVDRLL